MEDEPKVYLTDEQWEIVKRFEEDRKIAADQTNLRLLSFAREQLDLLKKQYTNHADDMFNMFAASALTGLLHAGYSYSEAPPLAIKSAVAMMDALQENAR